MAVPRMPKKGIASVAAAWPADCSRPKGNGANLGFEAKLWATGQRADQHTRRRPSVDGISLGREEFFVTNKWNSNCQRPMVNNAQERATSMWQRWKSRRYRYVRYRRVLRCR